MSRLLAVTVLLQGILLAYGQLDMDVTVVKFDHQLDTKQACTKPSFETTFTDLTDFNNQMKEWHDYFRCHHGASPVTIDSTLKGFAQSWAQTLADTVGLPASYHSSGRYEGAFSGWRGENIFAGLWEADIPAWKAIRGSVQFGFSGDGISYNSGWYCSEYNDYLDSNDKQGDVYLFGHFSQVVWTELTSIGCGTAKGNGRTYIVCQYSPAGNIMNDEYWIDNHAMAFNDLQGDATYSTVCPSSDC